MVHVASAVMLLLLCFIFFFFKQKTAYEMRISDWSSDVCSSDLRVRLRALTKTSYDDVWSADGRALPEHVCGYGLGYFVELDADRRKFRFEEYQLGQDRKSVV